MQYVAGFLFSFLVSSQNSLAESYRLNGNYFVRDTNETDFADEKSKIGVLEKGSEFNVLQKVPMLNGAEALQIEVTKLAGSSRVGQSATGKIWIFKGNPAHFTETNSGPSTTTEAQSPTSCVGCPNPASANSQAQENNTTSIGNTAREIISAHNQATETARGDLDQQIKNYSESTEVAAAISWANRNKKARSTRTCYRTIKKALATKDKKGNSLIDSWYSDLAAINAKNSLKKRGFVNLMEIEPYKSKINSPSQAPKGAVLVYSSGLSCGPVKDCGHVEIKMDHEGKPGYVSDYASQSAVNETPNALRFGTRYKLIGVMIKPMETP